MSTVRLGLPTTFFAGTLAVASIACVAGSGVEHEFRSLSPAPEAHSGETASVSPARAASTRRPPAATVAIIAIAGRDMVLARDTMLATIAKDRGGAARVVTLVADGGTTTLLEADAGRAETVPGFAGGDVREPSTLRAFGRYVAEGHPEPVVTIFWGHGKGWRGFGGGDGHGLGGHAFSLADGAFEAALAALHDGLGRKIDVLGFDACLMGAWEVAQIAEPYASVFVASPDLVPKQGWPLDRVLDALAAAAPAASARELAEGIVARYADGGRRYDSLIALDLGAMAQVDAKAAELARAALAAGVTPLAVAPEGVLAYGDRGAIDLGELADAIANRTGTRRIQRLARALKETAMRARVARSCRARHCDALGLSVHAVHSLGDAAYRNPRARWNRDPAWSQWLASRPSLALFQGM